MKVNHDPGQTGYPTRTYTCEHCERDHVFKRSFEDIPELCPACGAPMHRNWQADGVRFHMVTPIRDVKHKLRQEEREGKRPRPIDRNMNPHIATV
jgi:predicted nucleic acid-binding Zn ribbon protein